MVSSTVIEIILRARDQASDTAKKVDDVLKNVGENAGKAFDNGTQSASRMEKAVAKLGNIAGTLSSNLSGVFQAVNSAMEAARTKINSLITSAGKLSPRFRTIGESIKNSLSTSMEAIKSKMRNVTTSITNQVNVLKLLKPEIIFRGNTEPFDNSRMHVYSALQELSRMNFRIPIDIDTAAERIGRINAAFESIHTKGQQVAQSISSVTDRIRSGFDGVASKISSFNDSMGRSAANVKNLASQTGLLGQGFTVLKGALSNIIGMIGYDLVANLVEGTRATINARGNIESFSKRLNMSSAEVNSFTTELSKLQQEFRKVDMQSVGASALELANKLDVPKNKISDLTRTVAVMSSAFIREGRTSEDAILAVSDALDGQFRRLQEIGITQDILKNNGWNGHIEDTASLIDALNKSMEELGIEETARQVTNLDDAWQVLNVAMSHLLTEIIIPLTPLLVGLIMTVSDAANAISTFWKELPDGAKIAILATVLGALAAVIYGMVIEAIKDLIIKWLFAETSIIASIAPFIAVGLAIGALALVVYECGKAMGWWTDGASALQVIGEALTNIFNQIVACLTAVYNGFMEVVSPAITDFWNYLVQVLQPLQGTFAYLWGTLLRIGDAFGGASRSGSLFANIGRILGTIFTGLLFNLQIFIAFLVPAIKLVINVLSTLINFVIDLAQAFSLLLQGDIIGFLEGLGGALFNLVKNLAVHIGGAIVDIGHNLIGILGQIFPGLAGIIRTEMDNIVQTISGAAGWIVGALLDLGGRMWNALLEALGIHSPGHMANAIKEEMGHIAEFIINAIPRIIQALVGLASDLLSSFRDKVAELPEIIRSIFGDGAGDIAEWLVSALIPAIDTLLLILQEFSIYLNTVVEAVQLLMQGDFEGFFELIINGLMNFVTNVGMLLNNLLLYLWTWASQVVMSMIQAGLDSVNGFITWISTLPGRAWTWLWNTITIFINWASNIVNQTKQAGLNSVNGFITWISTLPGKAWTWLWNTINKVISFGSQIVQKIKDAAQRMVQGFADKVKNLPTTMWNELMNIKQKIQDGVGTLVDAIKNLGWQMLDGFKSALGIASPGHMSHAIEDEMGYINNNMASSLGTLEKSAADVGQSILDGYNSNDFSSMTSVIPDITVSTDTTSMATATVQPVIDPTQNQEVTDTMMQQNTLLADNIGVNTTTINNDLLSTMISLANLAYTSTDSTNTVGTNNAQVTQSYNNMMIQVNNMLQNIINKNLLGWQNVKTTTENNLKSILNSTKSVTTQMIQAWQTMKNSIVKAAENIRSESTNRFDRLWSTIKTFYHNIQHPGGAGPQTIATSGRNRKNSGGFSSVRSAISTGLSNVLRPQQNKISSIGLSSMGFNNNEIEYLIPRSSSEGATVQTDDVMKFLERGGAGSGWDSIVSPNTEYIKKTSQAWSVAGPVILGKYPTGLDIFKVKDFENGTPTISFDTFRRMAEAVFSQCHYLFYMDSDMYGSWQAAAYNGNMNCSDSTDFLLAMARACGLSGSKVHGYWNGIGHFWANIAGHKMDTTGWMLHKTWTPSQSGGAIGIKTDDDNTPAIVEILRNILQYLKEKPEKEDQIIVTHDGRVTLNVDCNMSGDVPDGVTSTDVAGMLGDLILDKKVLKAIASSSDFQEYDNRYKERLNGKRARFS